MFLYKADEHSGLRRALLSYKAACNWEHNANWVQKTGFAFHEKTREAGREVAPSVVQHSHRLLQNAFLWAPGWTTEWARPFCTRLLPHGWNVSSASRRGAASSSPLPIYVGRGLGPIGICSAQTWRAGSPEGGTNHCKPAEKITVQPASVSSQILILHVTPPSSGVCFR